MDVLLIRVYLLVVVILRCWATQTHRWYGRASSAEQSKKTFLDASRQQSWIQNSHLEGRDQRKNAGIEEEIFLANKEHLKPAHHHQLSPEKNAPLNKVSNRKRKREPQSRRRRGKRRRRTRGNKLRRKRRKTRNHNHLLKSSPATPKDHKIGAKNHRKRRYRSKIFAQSFFNDMHREAPVTSHRHRFGDKRLKNGFPKNQPKKHHRSFENVKQNGSPRGKTSSKNINQFLVPITLITSQGLLKLPLNPDIRVTIRVLEKSVYRSSRLFPHGKTPRVKGETKGFSKQRGNGTQNQLQFRSSTKSMVNSPFLKTKIKISQNHCQNRVDGHLKPYRHRERQTTKNDYHSKQFYYHYDYDSEGGSVLPTSGSFDFESDFQLAFDPKLYDMNLAMETASTKAPPSTSPMGATSTILNFFTTEGGTRSRGEESTKGSKKLSGSGGPTNRISFTDGSTDDSPDSLSGVTRHNSKKVPPDEEVTIRKQNRHLEGTQQINSRKSGTTFPKDLSIDSTSRERLSKPTSTQRRNPSLYPNAKQGQPHTYEVNTADVRLSKGNKSRNPPSQPKARFSSTKDVVEKLIQELEILAEKEKLNSSVIRDFGVDPCDKWRSSTVERLLQRKALLPLLPTCPCDYPDDLIYNDYIFDSALNQTIRWRPMTNEKDQMNILFRGARSCIRSIAFEHGVSLSSQTCCYDENRELITRGQSAGTPTMVSPEISPGLYQLMDVAPWKACSGNFVRFHTFRKPNNGRNCSSNPDEISLRIEAEEAADY